MVRPLSLGGSGLLSCSSRGAAYPGFVYDSESGARNVPVKLQRNPRGAFVWPESMADSITAYWNGGGIFEMEASRATNCTVLASLDDLPEKPAVIVACSIGQGCAILSGIHPEHPPAHSDSAKVSLNLMHALLTVLDLDMLPLTEDPPEETYQQLSAAQPEAAEHIAHSLLKAWSASYGDALADASDTFVLYKDAQEAAGCPHKAIFVSKTTAVAPASSFLDRDFFGTLRSRYLGQTLIYGEVISSTQTLLDKSVPRRKSFESSSFNDCAGIQSYLVSYPPVSSR